MDIFGLLGCNGQKLHVKTLAKNSMKDWISDGLGNGWGYNPIEWCYGDIGR
ncbi:hypothetical protein [Flagellimonas allohymeniacidonis]|uniref:hypothetical protein n=1 Tax=Flagellimonas allohymeniacidonis TaxID=2517819 RepID=UPI0013EEA17A|nr:hypothetical protein [Allomuricauda hymeniacidonis]